MNARDLQRAVAQDRLQTASDVAESKGLMQRGISSSGVSFAVNMEIWENGDDEDHPGNS
jgi:hypothetical protein